MWNSSIVSLMLIFITSCGPMESSTSWRKLSDTAIDGKTPSNFYRQFLFDKQVTSTGEIVSRTINSVDNAGLDELGVSASFMVALLEDGRFVLSYSEFKGPVDNRNTVVISSLVRTVVRHGRWNVIGAEIDFGGLASGRGTTFWRKKMRSPGIMVEFNEDLYSKGLKGRSVLFNAALNSGVDDPLTWKSSQQ